MPPQLVDLSDAPLDYAWCRLTIQRAKELGVFGMEFLENHGDVLTRSVAVERVYLELDSALGITAVGAPPERSATSPSIPNNSAGNTHSSPPESGSERVPSGEFATSANVAANGDQQILACKFGVTIEQQTKSLWRRKSGRKMESSTDKDATWRLAAYLLSATATGRTIAEITNNWKRLGGKAPRHAKGTIENAVLHVNNLLFPLRLIAERPNHNGPWIIAERSSDPTGMATDQAG
jgi:hypothetical protein